MRFILLGTGPGIPQLDKHLSSLYLQGEGVSALWDCGEGCSRALLQHGLSRDHLDFVVITHYHPDHVSGLFMLLQMLYLEGRTKPLELYLPECPEFIEQSLRYMYTIREKFKFELEILLLDELRSRHQVFEAVISDHLLGYTETVAKLNLPNQMRSWSLKYQHAGRSMLYSSDLSTTDSIAHLLPGLDLIIVDALHPPAEQILKLAELQIRHVLLTHGISEGLSTALGTGVEEALTLNNTVFSHAQEGVWYEL